MINNTHKKCSTCQKEKSIDAFGKRSKAKDGLRGQCKACEHQSFKRYRANNKKKIAQRLQQWQKDNPEKRRAGQKRLTKYRKKIVREAKEIPCIDCGKQYPPEVMDLDHIRGQKEFQLSLAHAYSVERIRKEIAKCEVRCPTCHRLRHWKIDKE
jgi:DNA-directed RNA polymerase subunit RPC12/RpoP